MDNTDPMKAEKSTKSVRERADAIRKFRCKHLVAVIEDPKEIQSIGAVIRNANALGVEKVYVVDPRRELPDDWHNMRVRRPLSRLSVSATKWTFTKRFDSTEACLEHLEKSGFTSVVTSPHIKGRKNVYLNDGDYTIYSKLAV